MKRVVAVADRGLLSTDNLAELQAIELPGGGTLEFILAVPGRRYTDFVDLLGAFHAGHCAGARQELIGEVAWDKLRLIVAHDPETAAQASARRNGVIAELEKRRQSGPTPSTIRTAASAGAAANCRMAAPAPVSTARSATNI